MGGILASTHTCGTMPPHALHGQVARLPQRPAAPALEGEALQGLEDLAREQALCIVLAICGGSCSCTMHSSDALCSLVACHLVLRLVEEHLHQAIVGGLPTDLVLAIRADLAQQVTALVPEEHGLEADAAFAARAPVSVPQGGLQRGDGLGLGGGGLPEAEDGPVEPADVRGGCLPIAVVREDILNLLPSEGPWGCLFLMLSHGRIRIEGVRTKGQRLRVDGRA
mmetsp:Transcript_98868/g.250938  ORF Transcript_98868/g.250938 Transcript_98868/m.250938 type:complete len:224 (+) Transcript_98868:564-1235(+)